MIYLAGPISDGDDPHEWHHEAQRIASTECINPFTEFGDSATDSDIVAGDFEMVRGAQAVLCRRISGYNLVGASMETREAWNHGVPVIVWNDADNEPPLFLREHATGVYDELSDAVAATEEVLND